MAVLITFNAMDKHCALIVGGNNVDAIERWTDSLPPGSSLPERAHLAVFMRSGKALSWVFNTVENRDKVYQEIEDRLRGRGGSCG